MAWSISYAWSQAQTAPVKSDTLPYEPSKSSTYDEPYRFGDPFSHDAGTSPLNLKDPSQLDVEVHYDSSISYSIYERIGETDFRPATYMSFNEYNRLHDQEIIRNYWSEASLGLDGESAVSGRRLIPKLYISPVFDRIFGGSYVDIQPTGFVNLDFGGRWQFTDNPQIPERQRRTGGFNFNMQMSTNVTGKIGEKLAVTFNFDNNNSFDFQNDMKVDYTGFEEDIIKKIEIGNVSMPISNSLIAGAQALFGIKTQLQFGKLFVTGIASRQRGRADVITIENGVDEQQFELRGSMYDENRHFFLGHFFRDHYGIERGQWLSLLPQVTSGVNVTRVEVYVLNRTQNAATARNFIAMMDLGESKRVHNPMITKTPQAGGAASNSANNLYTTMLGDARLRETGEAKSAMLEIGFEESVDFVMQTSARKLDPTEYRINKQLGYISLVRKLSNDEVLAVAYEYTYNGQSFKVGELSEDYQGLSDDKLIYLKMLRPNKINTRVHTWDLMMKNIYNLNAGQIQQDGFSLRIHYRDDRTGIDNPSLHEGRLTKDRPLIEIMGLDQLNRNGDRQRDGNFDYIEGVTVNSRNGTIIFPVLEPFAFPPPKGGEPWFSDDETRLKEKYIYDTLYRTTKADAELIAAKNKYFLVGKYSGGSGSEIVLPGINVSQGSVVVMAGNTPLTEGLDYSVDYNLGRVRILNQGVLSSGKTIQISYEKADLFNFQTRWLTGANFDYIFNDNLSMGATILHVNERPGGITRYAIGDEPTRNTKYGFNINYQQESRLLTQIVDAIPLINTKEQSQITFNAEVAQLVPGTSNIVEGKGTSYIDDFEAAVTNGGNLQSRDGWKIAATPQHTRDRLEGNGNEESPLVNNYRRAKLSWYIVDNTVFYGGFGNRRPDNLDEEDLENHYVRGIRPQEIYPQRDQTLLTTYEPVLDVAYFPSERGPYNYSPNLNNEGLLANPRDSWAGVTNNIGREVDFDKNNVEYIEFWMMDPFIETPNGRVLDGVFNQNNTTGGRLVFNLGNVSEDVIPDDRHGFENGLPTDGDLSTALMSEWGYTPSEQPINNQFENSASIRVNQDVGMDGLKNEDEQTFFESYINSLDVSPQALQQISADPSADDFSYFLGDDLDAQDAKILERYKNYNGHDGNSPVAGRGITQAYTAIPENEDLNDDLTVSSLEEYYEYGIDLQPGELDVGSNHIVDRITDASGEANWYLFRIPVRDPDRIYGNIDGFKTIKYLRMYLTDFEQPVVLRFAGFRFVNSSWRKFQTGIVEPGLNEIPEITPSDFKVSVVSIEANSTGSEGAPPYALPPGLDRDRDNTSFLNNREDETSLQICVENLEDKDGRAVYKNTNYDLINYGRIKMFLHAHSYNGDVVRDDEVSAFLRFGTDYNENYYEIEVPLKITPEGLNGTTGDELRRVIWPLENEIDLAVSELLALKSSRNRNDIDVLIPYSIPSEDGRYKLTIKGRPDMSSLLTTMIGVRNVESTDRQPKSVCIWANELRVTDFDKNKGWAANARLSTKLADLATINASTRYQSIGFGSIQQRISERSREDILKYDVSAQVNVDKFLLPQKTGLRVPMYVSIEKTKATPQFDPLDPDVPLDAAIESFSNEEEGQRYRRIVEDRTTRRSINFTNVRKDKVKKDAKRHVYDVENLSFTYAFSDQLTTSISTETLYRKTQGGGVAYNFSPKGLTLEPFKSAKAFKSPYLKVIKDLNISLLPNSLTARADLNRNFTHTQLFNDRLTTEGMLPYYERLFTFNRTYGFRWNIFKSLNLDYSARANAVIDESDEFVFGDIDTQAERDYILEQIKGLGRMKNFNQTASANYKLPFDKLPLTDWVTGDVRYSIGYNWLAGSLGQEDDDGNFFGHTISNNRDQQATGKIDFVKLYNKVGFLKAANTPTRSNRRSSSSRPSPNSGDEEKAPSGAGMKVVNSALRFLMAVRNVNVTYGVRESTGLSGFLPSSSMFGMDSSWMAPGWEFIAGSQDPSIRHVAADNDWLTRSPYLTAPFQQTAGKELNLRASVEPWSDLKIQVDAKRSNNGSFQEIFRYDTLDQTFNSLTPSRGGSYSISFMSINTAFEKLDTTHQSAVFDQFVSNIDEMHRRLASELNSQGINGRYDTISQDVMVPAFIAAYQGVNVRDVSSRPFPIIPLPNWRVDYAGLARIPALSEIFSSINITHAYRSVFNISNYTNSLRYQDNISLDNDIVNYPLATQTDTISGNLVPVYIMNQVTIAEQFAPFLGINVRTKTNLNARIDYKRDRNLSLNLSNAQVTETRNSDVSFDIGYTKADLKLPFKIKGQVYTIKNEVTFRMALTIRDTKAIQRKIDEAPKATNGNKSFQLRPTIAYKFNDQLDLTMYFDRNNTNPLVGSFNRRTTAFGFQLRFNLAQ
ncbi:MAG: cell surface protein SprA [Cyclobacteriaceae bacterium]